MAVTLNLYDPVLLTAQLIDIFSVSHHEEEIATIVYSSLADLPHLQIDRHGNTIIARTHYGREKRVILAGHLDTVPAANNIPHSKGEGTIKGLGAVDMKSGVAVFLHLALYLTNPRHDITYLFYDCEEVESHYNGLGKLYQEKPELFTGDFAILGEPTNGKIEAGCQGSLRGIISSKGVRAHSARSWLGDNAIHHLGPILELFNSYTPRIVVVDGCEYREGLSVVKIHGGIAGNVIPDTAELAYNFRFAPDRDAVQARKYITEFFMPHLGPHDELTITDIAAGARPGLNDPLAQELIAVSDGKIQAKYGWTDVARFAALGIPAVNLGPGDPSLAHKPEEYVYTEQIEYVSATLSSFLSANI